MHAYSNFKILIKVPKYKFITHVKYLCEYPIKFLNLQIQ